MIKTSKVNNAVEEIVNDIRHKCEFVHFDSENRVISFLPEYGSNILTNVYIIGHKDTTERIKNDLRIVDGIFNCFVVAQDAPNHSDTLRPSPLLKFLHGLNMGRVYYHVSGSMVRAVNYYAGNADFDRLANVWPDDLCLLSDFRRHSRTEWKHLPAAQLWRDTIQSSWY